MNSARSGRLPPDHVPDLLAPGLRLVFCGTSLGRRSAEERAYYAHPGNRFWRTLHEVGLTPSRLAPHDWPCLIDYGIGLTDVGKTHFGNDADLPDDAFDPAALADKMARYRPGLLAFTSKNAAAAALGVRVARLEIGPQTARLGETPLFILSSPSGSASGYWNDGAAWHALARHLGVTPAATGTRPSS